MVRFLHTGDWQLGMTRHFLSEEAQPRFSQDRVDAIRRLSRIAVERECAFLVVCGDVFESNQVDQRTVARALEALREVSVPVFLLPGNHDALDAAGVYHSRAFRNAKPDHVTVLEDATPVRAAPGVEVVGAPWLSRRPARDLAGEVAEALPPAEGTLRVLVAHGGVDLLSPDATDPALIRLAAVEAALADGRLHYVALGDRHSVTEIGGSGRVWYAGAPEPTGYTEERPGHVLVVDLAPERVEVTPVPVARWRFLREAFPLDADEDLDALETWLADRPDKERTIVKLAFTGTLTLARRARLDEILARAETVFAAVEVWERRTELAVVPDDTDFADLDLGGFARSALESLRAEEGEEARDALALLVRLARREP
jgi:DNA repair exonuclease SbcCD nuclease subunit